MKTVAVFYSDKRLWKVAIEPEKSQMETRCMFIDREIHWAMQKEETTLIGAELPFLHKVMAVFLFTIIFFLLGCVFGGLAHGSITEYGGIGGGIGFILSASFSSYFGHWNCGNEKYLEKIEERVDDPTAGSFIQGVSKHDDTRLLRLNELLGVGSRFDTPYNLLSIKPPVQTLVRRSTCGHYSLVGRRDNRGAWKIKAYKRTQM